MKKHWEQSGFLQHALFVFVTLCFAKMVTFLVQSRACCAVVNKLSTLFGFAVHCKTRDFNISLDELLFIQVFKGSLQPSLERLTPNPTRTLSWTCWGPHNTPQTPVAFWYLWRLNRLSAFSNNSILLLKEYSGQYYVLI